MKLVQVCSSVEEMTFSKFIFLEVSLLKFLKILRTDYISSWKIKTRDSPKTEIIVRTDRLRKEKRLKKFFFRNY